MSHLVSGEKYRTKALPQGFSPRTPESTREHHTDAPFFLVPPCSSHHQTIHNRKTLSCSCICFAQLQTFTSHKQNLWCICRTHGGNHQTGLNASSCPVLSCSVLFCPDRSSPALSCLGLSCPDLPYSFTIMPLPRAGIYGKKRTYRLPKTPFNNTHWEIETRAKKRNS